MHSKTSTNRTRTTVATLAALLACGAFVSSRARAECSRYVSYHEQKTDLSGTLELLDVEVISSKRVVPISLPVESPKPCSGAMCSGNPAVPWAPIHTIPERVNQWAFLESMTPVIGRGGVVHDRRETILSLPLLVSSIFHPPRYY